MRFIFKQNFMDYNTFFWVLIAIVIFGYALDKILDQLNKSMWSDKLPAELEGIYDAERYKKSQQYQKDNMKLSFIQSTISVIAILAMLFFQGFALVDHWVSGFTNNMIITALVFFGILGFASDLLGTPFSWYDTFVIEERYGFNKSTKKIFITDKIKGWILTAIIGGGLLALIIWFYSLTQAYFWLYAWAAISVFMIFITMFYSNLIVPLFNKQTPLEEGELRDAIFKFCDKVGYKLDNVFVIDGSKRSTKSNAYFSGLGPKKRIVLFDTLVNDLTTDEIVAVLAHEIGHYKKKHTLSGIFLSVLQTGLTLYILSVFINNQQLAEALGSSQPKFHLGLIAFSILYSPISTVLSLGLNVFSRKNEYQADHFAGKNHKPEALIEALKKLSIKNLSNLTPHPVYVFFHYSHPPLLKRIRALKEIKGTE